MKLLRFVPIKLTLFLILGILIGTYFNTSILFSGVLAILFLSILALFFLKSTNRESISFGIIACLTTISIGILAISLWQPKNWQSHYSNQNTQEAHAFNIKIREVLKPTSFSNRYIGLVQAVDGHETTGRVILNTRIDSTEKTFKVDYELLAYGVLEEVKPPLNPHQFDYRNYLEGLGIYHQLRLTKGNSSQSKIYATTINGLASTLRNKISSKLKEAGFRVDELGVIQALLLGQRNDISETTYNDYKNAGAVHILAVSGLHIGILLLLLQFILRPLELLPKGKTVKLVAIVLLLWGFALLAGFSASVVRAVTMFSFVAYALYTNRPSNTFNILALSMFFVLLLINPMLLFQVGFQMSYAAVFAIVWIYPMLQKLWFPKNRIVRKIWQLLSVSVAAQLGVLPISLFYFHQFPGLFFISNLLIVPFMGVVLGMGILVIILSLSNSLPDFLVTAYNALIELMNTIIAWVAQQEGFVFKNISFDAMQLVLSYTIVFSLLLAFTKITFRRVVVFLCSILLFQLWAFYASYQTEQKQQLVLAHQIRNTVLLNQTGSSLHVRTSDPETNQRLLTDYQVAERVRSISYGSLRNSYLLDKKRLLVLDSLSVYPKDIQPDFLLLTESPKINLERLIDSINPKYIIADGSNYRSYIERWRKTCAKRKLPFHYTGEKGAYYFE